MPHTCKLRIRAVLVLLTPLYLAFSTLAHASTLQINAGGGAVGSWVGDEYYSSGTNTSGTTASINNSLVPNPAPQSVYQSERWGAMTYTIPNLTAGATYTVNLHFAEIYWTAAGQREFNVLINGVQVLTNFDIFAAAGGANIAIVKSYTAVASGSGVITIQFTLGAADNPKISGIEILSTTQINAGGGAVGTWAGDEDYSGGNTSGTASSIDTALVSNPAPQSVYQTERWGAMTYTIPNLTAGATYTVNLHFAEIYWTAAGQREFNVLINGQQVLTNFDIFAAAGGANIAIVKSYTAVASSSGTITVQFTLGPVDNPKISGIEIIANPSAGIPWVNAWTVGAVQHGLGSGGDSGLIFNNQTERELLYTTTGGTAARLHISNQFGTGPLYISDVHIAQVSSGSTTIASTDKTVTFSGSTSVTIPAGSTVTSDSISFTVPALAYVAVSIYFTSSNGSVTSSTAHEFTEQTSYWAAGDVSGTSSLSSPTSMGNYYFLTGLDTQSSALNSSVVTLGASITGGYASTNNANHRWPDYLASRLNTTGLILGVANEGIAGNMMLTDQTDYGLSAPDRFQRDVLSQPGAKYVIMSDDPINDIGGNPSLTSSQFISVYQTMISEARAQGIKFYCSTLTPFGGSAGWTSEGETTREAINTWIRAGNCDGIVDQDTATHNPSDPTEYLPAFNSGDSLHPNDAGYQAIANAVNEGLFTATRLPPIQSVTSSCESILPGQGLAPGESVLSCDGRFELTLQTNGNLVLYEGATVLWSTNTAGQTATEATLLSDGNFVLYGPNATILWQSNTAGLQGQVLDMQVDGNLVIYTSSNTAVWASNTCCH